MVVKIPVERLEVGVRALARHEAQLHQLAGGVVDEDQQRAGLAALLEPAMVAAVDLDQLTVALAPKPRLVEGPALRARQPQTFGHHPSPQRLLADPELMLVQQHLGRQRRPEVRVPGLDQLDRILPDAFVAGSGSTSATRLVDQPAATIDFVPGQQPVRLALADRQHGCRRSHRPTASPHVAQHFDPS